MTTMMHVPGRLFTRRHTNISKYSTTTLRTMTTMMHVPGRLLHQKAHKYQLVLYNYPQNYDNNDACAWQIIAPEGTLISVSTLQLPSEL